MATHRSQAAVHGLILQRPPPPPHEVQTSLLFPCTGIWHTYVSYLRVNAIYKAAVYHDCFNRNASPCSPIETAPASIAVRSHTVQYTTRESEQFTESYGIPYKSWCCFGKALTCGLSMRTGVLLLQRHVYRFSQTRSLLHMQHGQTDVISLVSSMEWVARDKSNLCIIYVILLLISVFIKY
jgi:hypothetical protein